MKFIYLFLGLILLLSFCFAGELTALDSKPLLDRNTELKPIEELTPSTDNIKTYEPLIEKITVKEKDLTPVATIKLLTPKNFKVGVGYQLVAEFEITSQQAYLDFLNQMYFYNAKTGNTPIKRSFDIKEKIDYYESVPTYQTTCLPTSDKNLQETCTTIEKGTRLVQRTRYDLYSGKEFPLGETKTLSIWTNTLHGEKMEWIPDLFGVIVDEWAFWEASLSNGLHSYWKLDDTNTSTSDSLNRINGTNTGVDVNGIPYLYGRSYFYNAATDRELTLMVHSLQTKTFQ